MGKVQKYKNQNVESEKTTSKIWKGSERRKFQLKGSESWKIRTTTTTYGVVPMDSKACGGLV